MSLSEEDSIMLMLVEHAFDSMDGLTVRPPMHAAAMCLAPPPRPQELIMVIDPAAGGPQSDFALITFFRHRGQFVVRTSSPPL